MQILVTQDQVPLFRSYQRAFGFSVLIHLVLVFLLSFFEPPIVPATKTLLEIDLRQTEGPTQLKSVKNKMNASKTGSLLT